MRDVARLEWPWPKMKRVDSLGLGVFSKSREVTVACRSVVDDDWRVGAGEGVVGVASVVVYRSLANAAYIRLVRGALF